MLSTVPGDRRKECLISESSLEYSLVRRSSEPALGFGTVLTGPVEAVHVKGEAARLATGISVPEPILPLHSADPAASHLDRAESRCRKC